MSGLTTIEVAMRSYKTHELECGCVTDEFFQNAVILRCDEHTCYREGCCAACRQPKMLMCHREKGHEGTCSFTMGEKWGERWAALAKRQGFGT